MKRKGFTLIELLVVIAIIALLMSILVPALARARQLAYRLLCQTNLAGIGKVMALYAYDSEEEYPRAGGPGILWGATGKISQWWGPGPGPLESAGFMDGTATITSCFFLLVKYDYTTPKQFYCKGDEGARIFKAREAELWAPLSSAWDFGGGERTGKGGELRGVWPGACVSYSYHMPFNIEVGWPGFPISEASREDSPLCADRNPHLDSYAQDPDLTANTLAHQGDGQNVLYKDAHANFERDGSDRTGCQVGLNKDNIWTYGGDPDVGGGDSVGTPPLDVGDGYPIGKTFSNDAYLVNEVQTGTLP